MKSTASIQVAIDYFDEQDAAYKMSLAMKIAPVVTGLFANSCVYEGKLSDFKNYRSHIWQHTDAARCGIVDAVFKSDFSFQDWVEYALDVPVLFIQRGEQFLGPVEKTFRLFLKDGFGVHKPRYEDWQLHLTCLFPEVRLRQWIEFRSTDRQVGPLTLASPVFLKVLLYHSDILREANELLKFMTAAGCREGMQSAARFGMDGNIQGRSISGLARDLMELVFHYRRRGRLEFLSEFESQTLDRVYHDLIIPKTCPADQTIRTFRTRRDLRQIINQSAL